jgi:peptidoglycan hydrolase-like protein with peptidoglycan-binding domain
MATAPASAPAPAAVNTDKTRWVQTALNAIAGEVLGVDGKVGPKTTAAIKRFQEHHGLVATGVLDAATESALHDAVQPVTRVRTRPAGGVAGIPIEREIPLRP